MDKEVKTSDSLQDSSHELSSLFSYARNWFDLQHNHGEATGWAPTPYGDSRKVARHQRQVARQLQRRAERHTPDYLPSPIIEHVEMNIMARFYQRAADSHNGRDARLKKDFEGVDSDIARYYRKGEKGHATPYQLLRVRSEFGFRSIELARLTHPYGRHIEKLEPMRRAVMVGLKALNAHFFDENELELHALVGDNGLTYSPAIQNSLLMTRERRLAQLDDHTQIKERSSFILRIDAASDFDQELADKIRSTNVASPTWERRVMAVGQLNEVVPPLLTENNFATAVPISTTIYAYNRITEGLTELNATKRTVPDPDFERVQRLAANSEQSGIIFIPGTPGL